MKSGAWAPYPKKKVLSTIWNGHSVWLSSNVPKLSYYIMTIIKCSKAFILQKTLTTDRTKGVFGSLQHFFAPLA
jgi:hypothetical protein